MPTDRERRAEKRRASMTARVAEHGEPETLGPFGYEGVVLTAELSRAAFVLAGGEMPSYSRATMPARIIRGRDRGCAPRIDIEALEERRDKR